MINVTYARLEEVLLSLGFTFDKVFRKNKIFHHAETGALVIYPEFPADTVALPRHISGIKSILDAYGIADPDVFTFELQRAS